MGTRSIRRLWEEDHPYYMSSGNYHAAGCHESFRSFDEFLDDWSRADLDMNRVHRWDWREGEDWDVPDDGSEDKIGRLYVYFILQRKASTLSCDVIVRRSDESRVVEYLRPHAEREALLWAPMNVNFTENEGIKE